LTLYQLQIQGKSKGEETQTLRLFSISKIHISHHFEQSKLNRCSILVELAVDNAKEVDCFFLCDVEFPGVIEEQVRLRNNSSMGEGGRSGRRRVSHCLVAGIRMLIDTTSDLVANEAFVVVHVLHSLSGEKSNGIQIHDVGVTMIKWQ